jgi:NTP pyrophosphatase (non-canonical NTP hydrolase)
MIEIKTKMKGGFLEQPCRIGAMLDFSNIKEEKLIARKEKYRNGEYSFADLYEYLNGELKELEEAWWDGNDPRATIRELADISNCIDMMAFCLIEDGVR